MTPIFLASMAARFSAGFVLICALSVTALAQATVNRSCNALRTRNAPKPKAFFTTEKFSADVIEWYSEYLSVMNEPALLPQHNCAIETYRFLWLRTFHAPIAIRVWTVNGQHFLVAKQLSGYGGYEAGRLVINRIRKLSSAEWDHLKHLLAEISFWDLPTEESGHNGRDGARWIVEGLRDSKYHVTDRWSAEADYRETCLYFLRLSNLRVRESDIY